jgi:hypothetical protein
MLSTRWRAPPPRFLEARRRTSRSRTRTACSHSASGKVGVCAAVVFVARSTHTDLTFCVLCAGPQRWWPGSSRITAQVSIECSAVAFCVAMTDTVPCLCRERPCMDAHTGQAGQVLRHVSWGLRGNLEFGMAVPDPMKGVGARVLGPWSREKCWEAEEGHLHIGIPRAVGAHPHRPPHTDAP